VETCWPEAFCWCVVQRTQDDCPNVSDAVSLPAVEARVAAICSRRAPSLSRLAIETGLTSWKL